MTTRPYWLAVVAVALLTVSYLIYRLVDMLYERLEDAL